MSGYNGAGVFVRSRNCQNDALSGIDIEAANIDEDLDAIAAALSNVLVRDGQAAMTAPLPFGGQKGIGLADPTQPQDAATKNYVDTKKKVLFWAGTGSIFRDGSAARGAIRFPYNAKITKVFWDYFQNVPNETTQELVQYQVNATATNLVNNTSTGAGRKKSDATVNFTITPTDELYFSIASTNNANITRAAFCVEYEYVP